MRIARHHADFFEKFFVRGMGGLARFTKDMWRMIWGGDWRLRLLLLSFLMLKQGKQGMACNKFRNICTMHANLFCCCWISVFFYNSTHSRTHLVFDKFRQDSDTRLLISRVHPSCLWLIWQDLDTRSPISE